tara:strand:- start:6508 stop:6978 length:471 start_codon:yes stop_codon:yes gene_type:complete
MNSLDKYSEMEWNKYISHNSGISIKDMMVNDEEVVCDGAAGCECYYCKCDGECNDCGCAELDSAKERKETPVFSGVLNYFPDAIRAVAKCSFIGNEQHNPNTPLHWDRSKSGDEKDALMRHLLDAGTLDTDGIKHSTKVAWRALANLQKEIENDNK